MNKVPLLAFPIKLDIGAGMYPKEGFVRLDADSCNGATDIIWDITRGLPLPDNSVSELYTSHTLEHFTPIDLHSILREIYRVCASGAKLTIRVPHADHWAGRLPCHYNFWNETLMQAINEWLPHPGHEHYEGGYFDVRRIWREEPYHLLGEFLIVKT